ncbi:hypothetical protein [Nonomuraea typhae]|uniref:Uncharacterized protein n=1 Tax=Nonomuraea typhae TaxID=2603600 RepID=A0ABW7YZI5_9ACTN
MLKVASAVSALVVAVALFPSTDAPAQAAKVSAAPCSQAFAHAPNCQWWEKNGQKCLYCKQKKKKGGGWKKKYCEYKGQDDAHTIDCTWASSPTQAKPNRYCKTCVNETTGKVVSRECS